MIAYVDVHYQDVGATAACVVSRSWADERPVEEAVVAIAEVAPYEPGRFYRRELPCLTSVLGAIGSEPRVVVIDGYVWLGAEGDPGLGAHLYEALGGRSAVVGVAKTRYAGARAVAEVLRGGSRSPLYISSVGMDLTEVARRVREMHGPFRIPTLLRRVDQLCRGLACPADLGGAGTPDAGISA
jgi:deoxyribonuclease V